ncbi:MAG TPA: dTDP-4-dehydrorhamnose 3,5-epimerase [Syntrophales bacterium]|nr:dTDP-4-dehydrorhamnose 3,5-epimerase [Syntrophales bacterium]HPC31343.1 dTDP-4-dehydrorhamnose 3,5-epimerase [Syntrophales bacterium]HQG33249.1 dTDP-4-dehydrorhamnose 3,5-epimerase [Syntrophales bacterium]HQI35025.1 dTDP-4-dehydrorhamnose 3,5-epimerase [Syntrophales bacterium]HQJ29512.1 dTDP-4-dehydrorhamnose 3,5-epimerase [Syntrophales bacterium]
MPFTFSNLEIPGVILVSYRSFRDDRGFFAETYKASDFITAGIKEKFVQDNLSRSRHGAVRGLHYQLDPMAQGKLVMVVQGEIFDVAVDVRRGSPSFGRWVGRKLTAQEGTMLYIPPGFAHGFSVLSREAIVSYKVTREYAAALDRGIIFNDPDLAIPWSVEEPLLSPKDALWPRLRDADLNYVY